MQNLKQTPYSFYSTSSPICIRRNNVRIRRILSKNRIVTLSLLFGIASFIIIGIILFTVFLPSKSNQDIVANKYYKSIQIQKGYTLWSIATENMDVNYYKNTSEYVKEIKTINALVSDRVTAGNYMIIPYYSTD